MSVLVELVRGVGTDYYVLSAETTQQQGTRAPSILTIPGEFDTGKVRIVGYDLGILNEQITVSGLVETQDRTVVSGDPAYEVGVSKIYPGKATLRTACVKWWADADLGKLPNIVGFPKLKLPLGDEYYVIVAQFQFNEAPGQDFFSFSIVFRVVSGPDYVW